MDHAFWHDKWESDQIGFHQVDGNPLLKKHFDALELSQGARVFVPLCGKTRDIAWLLGQGCRVAGVELSETAVQQLFAEMDIKPDVTQVGSLIRYAAPHVEIFVGDFFDLDAAILGHVDAIFDRAALVALPEEFRVRYAVHLIETTQAARQLLITFDYDQSQMTGPPFAIPHEEVQARYESNYRIKFVQSYEVEGGFKATIPAQELVWLLTSPATHEDEHA